MGWDWVGGLPSCGLTDIHIPLCELWACLVGGLGTVSDDGLFCVLGCVLTFVVCGLLLVFCGLVVVSLLIAVCCLWFVFCGLQNIAVWSFFKLTF